MPPVRTENQEIEGVQPVKHGNRGVIRGVFRESLNFSDAIVSRSARESSDSFTDATLTQSLTWGYVDFGGVTGSVFRVSVSVSRIWMGSLIPRDPVTVDMISESGFYQLPSDCIVYPGSIDPREGVYKQWFCVMRENGDFEIRTGKSTPRLKPHPLMIISARATSLLTSVKR